MPVPRARSVPSQFDARDSRLPWSLRDGAVPIVPDHVTRARLFVSHSARVEASAFKPTNLHPYESVMKRTLTVSASMLCLLACSSEEPVLAPTAGSGGASGAAGESGGAGVGGTSGAAGTGGVLNSCPSNLLCGTPAVCCEVGEACIDGACATPCPSGVRCAGSCCAGDELCVSDTCTQPGKTCIDSFDCDEDEFCEITVNRCLPQPPGGPSCEYRPPAGPFDAIIEWAWTDSAIHPGVNQIASAPVVADLDGDQVPDVVVPAYGNGSFYLRAFDGKTGEEKWGASAEVYLPENQVGQFNPAIADLEGDGSVEIVVGRRGGGLIAFRGDGSVLWRSTLQDGSDWTGKCGANHGETVFEPAIAIANIDGQGDAEVVGGGVVFNSAGQVLSGLGRECTGDNQGYSSPVSIIADIDGDGLQDILGGSSAHDLFGNQLWGNGEPDGFTAIADLNGGGTPELVVVSSGSVRVQDATTGEVLARLDMPGSGRGGPPTVADFDGDGVMEFSAANGDYYGVFEFESSPAAISVKWERPTQDLTSGATGSSVFDFEGDGRAEVLYNDECYLRVYSGTDGEVLFETPSSTGTTIEYPVVVDVDADNNTEIIVVSNPGVPCPYDGSENRTGIFVYGDANDAWVRTRRIWNQHAYHITNVNADGSIPVDEVASWGASGFNNYRVSAQGSGVFNAPDLAIGLSLNVAGCPNTARLLASVSNLGALGVPAGIDVSFYYGADAAGDLLGSAKTTKPLLPGASEVVELEISLEDRVEPYSFYVVVDGSTAAESEVDECDEDNNADGLSGISCPDPVR